jgi:hypothetical protein
MRVNLTQTAFVAGELAPRMLGRTDLDRYAYGLKRCRNGYPVLHGGAVRRPGKQYLQACLTATASQSILVPFIEGQGQAWQVEFGNLQAKIIDSTGATVTTLTSPYPAGTLGVLDWAQSDRTLWLFHPNHPIHRLQRLGTGSWVLSEAPFTQKPFAEVGIRAQVAGTLSAATVGAGRTLTAAAAVFLASDIGRAVLFDAGIAVITAYSSSTVVTVEITRAFPSTTLTSGQWTIDSSPQANCTPGADGPVGATITLTLDAAGWRAADVGAVVRINGGLCRITAFSSDTVVNARVLRELASIVAAPALSWSLEPVIWSDTYGYPRTGTVFQQRLVVAGNTEFPRTVWGSRTGELLDFERWTDDLDSFAFTIDSDEATAITYVTGSQGLAVLTSSGEYSMRGGVEKPITPTNVQVKMESNHGTAVVRPVQVNRETVFIQRSGRKVRSYGYRYDFDGFSSPDIVALSEHITSSGVVWLAFAQEPDQILWGVRGDGRLISCTIDRDQQPSVLAWALHSTDGFVECVSSIPVNGVDEVWLIVRRTVNGSTVRYIERFNQTWEPWHPSVPTPDDIDRPVYGYTVDCGIVVDNPAGQTSFTVAHLVGKEVDIVADGAKMPRQTVPPGGVITLPRASKRTLIGLPFQTQFTLLTPEVITPQGTAQGQQTRTGTGALKFLNTIGAYVQNNVGNRQEIPFRRFGPDVLDQPPMPFTGLLPYNLLGWERGESEVSIYQDDPLPMHLLAVIRRQQVGG